MLIIAILHFACVYAMSQIAGFDLAWLHTACYLSCVPTHDIFILFSHLVRVHSYTFAQLNETYIHISLYITGTAMKILSTVKVAASIIYRRSRSLFLISCRGVRFGSLLAFECRRPGGQVTFLTPLTISSRGIARMYSILTRIAINLQLPSEIFREVIVDRSG